MKRCKLASAITALVLSTGSHATIISYGGYTHDTSTDIVSGYGLEWLQWDRTLGESIDSIQSQLDTLEGGGWTIASNVQMAQLFNAFDFGLTFDSDEQTSQFASTGFSTGDPGTEADEMFIAMFGDTITASGESTCILDDCTTGAGALYGLDLDGDYRINAAGVQDDYYSQLMELQQGNAFLMDDTYSRYAYFRNAGIALVRDVSAVPAPAAVWLFGSGLIGLIGFARRKVRA